MSELEAVLAAREARQHRQTVLWDAHGRPVVSLTVVSPGPVKTSPQIERVFASGLDCVQAVLDERGWAVLEADEVHAETGPEWAAAVDAPAEELKRALTAAEDGEPWGRLWDVDVVLADGPISRSSLGLPARKCLVCDEDAHGCARSRRHSLAELAAAVDAVVGQ